MNQLELLVKSRQFALGPQEGQIEFTIGLDTVNHVVTNLVGPTRTVTMDTLDNVLERERPSLIKLDVEGFESEVLRGATKTLGRSELKAIITEDRSAPVLEALYAAGFVEQSYDPFTRDLEPEKRQRHNTLFVRDRNFVQQRLIEASRVFVLNKSL